MKVTDIGQVLDLAKTARKQGRNFVPLFAGAAGLGKSQVAQQWAKAQGPNFGFLDLRPAYKEGGGDFEGFPVAQTIEGKLTMTYAVPEFWPTSGEGLILIEEPNRANNAIMNCLMQILTDRKVGAYSIPEGWFIAAAINPETAAYAVNTMDAALKNRFIIYDIVYDHPTFVDFAQKNFHPNVVQFINSGQWVYALPEQIQEDDKNLKKYISPRTFAQLSDAEFAGLKNSKDIHTHTSVAVLGEAIGNQYHKFIFEITPVTMDDLIKDMKGSIKKLESYSAPDTYRGDLLGVTVEDIIKKYKKEGYEKFKEKDLVKVAVTLKPDQTVSLLESLVVTDALKLSNEGSENDFQRLIKEYPELKKHLRSNLSNKED